MALAMAGVAMALYRSYGADQVRNFLIAGATLPVLSQFLLGSAVVRGLGHVIASMLVGLAQPLLVLVALLTTAHLFRAHVSSSGALLLNLGAAVAALGMIFALQRCFERELEQEPNRDFLTREWFGTATQMMLASSLIFLQGRTGVLITGMLLDAGQAGTYAAIERLADAALLGLVSVNMLVAPKFASLFAQQRRTELQRYARLAAWGATGFMLATVLPLVLFGKPILRCFGEEFVSGYPVLLVLLGGVAVNAVCGSVGFLLSMTGHQRRLLEILSIGLVINLVLSLFLVPRFGIIGAAWANTTAMLFWNLSMLYAVRACLGIWPNIGRTASNSIV
jgi:O-antigen/teichoic acid export membrane protein